jgi:predicted DNA-binding transcriptional regulator AlpA
MTKRPQTNQEPLPRYARPKGTAEFLEVARSTLWQWSKTRPNFPKPIKAGPKTTLFDLDAIQLFLDGENAQRGQK